MKVLSVLIISIISVSNYEINGCVSMIQSNAENNISFVLRPAKAGQGKERICVHQLKEPGKPHICPARQRHEDLESRQATASRMETEGWRKLV